MSWAVTRKVLRNAVIGATASSAGVLLFFLIRRVAIDLPYVWAWAMLSAICYGYLAIGFSIYGKGSNTSYKWKNAILSVLIVVVILAVSLITNPLVHVPAQTPIAISLAAGLSIVISDALA